MTNDPAPTDAVEIDAGVSQAAKDSVCAFKPSRELGGRGGDTKTGKSPGQSRVEP